MKANAPLSTIPRTLIALAVLASAVSAPSLAAPAKTDPNVLRIVPQSNLTTLDPVWTTSYTTMSHAYMIYDTLFATDANGKIQPQMVEKWTSSPDQKVWTFTLRDGLEFHDSKPVTSEDVVQSIKRWATKDAMGITMDRYLDSYETPNPKTWVMKFKEPFGLVLATLGKAAAPAFIMPKRVALTPSSEQIKESIGSGPYVFAPAEYKPGSKVVYLKNAKYKPRAEPASGTAGGKRVFVERAEWLIMRDPQTQLNALIANEVDMILSPASEQYSTIRITPRVNLVDFRPNGYQYSLRFNFLNPPFDDVLVRRAAMLALGQQQILRMQVGSPGMYRYCRSTYPCGTTYESSRTGIFTGEANVRAAKAVLEKSSYKGQPVMLMRPSDFPVVAKAPLMVKQQLEQAGFVVDMQSMDWSALVARRAKKEPVEQGGWNMFITAFSAGDNENPISMPAMNATGDKGWFGWHDDPVLEKIKMNFVRAKNDAERYTAAEAAQLRAIDQVTHVNLGQYNAPSAVRDSITGALTTNAFVLWNIKKDGTK